ncbi:MAG: nitrate- and nitrite sensing domain-containing protein, partial [Gammaproteobacteria bacterium]|nr:nitrate- and nitrite sensing domain-containing protein [Gammaproteobacteria bacterium]
FFKKLPEIRAKVDSLEESGFDYYSQFNVAVIDLIYHFNHHLQDDDFTHELGGLTELYTLLLEYQEYAGRERAQLHQVFSQQKLDLVLFQSISTNIFLQKKALKRYLNISDVFQSQKLNELMNQSESQEVQALRDNVFNKWQRNILLNKLQSLIGYGGLIHDFKNYLIRGEVFYLERFDQHFSVVQNLFLQFRALPGIDKQQLDHIDIIEKTFNKYSDALAEIALMYSEGKSIHEIDSRVQVDDNPAIHAIAGLQVDIAGLSSLEWWKISTQRIENSKILSNNLLMDITQILKKNKVLIWQSFYLYVALMFLILCITFLFGYFLVNRLVKQTSQIASAMNEMNQSGKFKALDLQGGNDEIGEIIEAFNALNAKRDQIEQESLENQSQLLEVKKVNALYKLSGGVAHNFNNMLAAILGYASLAINHKDVNDSEEVKGYLNNIIESGGHASALVENIIAYSQIESPISAASIKIGNVITQLIESQTIPSSIQLKCSIEEDLPEVRIELKSLERLFKALVINAIEAIDDQGFIEIGLHKVTLSNEKCHNCNESINGSFIELFIKDSGKGMDDDVMKNIFEPFFTSKHLSQGAGMGLSTVYGIIRKCGGYTQ